MRALASARVMRTVLAGDLGGTKCRFALVSENHEVLLSRRVPTPADGGALLAVFREQVDGMLAALSDPPDVVAVGLGVAGIVGPDGDRIVASNSLPLAGVDLRRHFRDSMGLPVAVLNDGQASALGEWVHGPVAGSDPLIMLMFGTGIGFGMVVHGQPYLGSTGAAGEAGHALHRLDGHRCACGRTGCYEAYCGGKALMERAAEVLGGPPSVERVHDLLAAAPSCSEAAAVLADAADAAGAMVHNLVHVLNPAAVVLGGGVLEGWPALGERIEATVRERCHPSVTDGLRFHLSRAGSDAVLRGAAFQAFRRIPQG